MNEIFGINDAINLLKEGLMLKDNVGSKFMMKKKRVSVYSSNSTYTLSFKDFQDLFKDNKFMIEDFEDAGIDLEKDKEYYSFKHK